MKYAVFSELVTYMYFSIKKWCLIIFYFCYYDKLKFHNLMIEFIGGVDIYKIQVSMQNFLVWKEIF